MALNDYNVNLPYSFHFNPVYFKDYGKETASNTILLQYTS